jgi:hypothetical protein
MNKVKVIKKGTRAEREAAPQSEKKLKRLAAREVVNNVSGWIVDLQERKRGEARMAFNQLFGNAPQPSEP